MTQELIALSWRYKLGERNIYPNKLFIGDPADVLPVSLLIENVSGVPNDIEISPIQGIQPDANNYHFKLKFNSGILAKPEQITIEYDSWSISYNHSNTTSQEFFILWNGSHPLDKLIISSSKPAELILRGVAAMDSSQSIVRTEVAFLLEWKRQLDVFYYDEGFPKYTDKASGDLEMISLPTFNLDISNNIPLFVGFINSNKVFNTNDEASTLKLRMTNKSFYDVENSDITFHHDPKGNTNSSLEVILEAGTVDSTPWALGTFDEVGAVHIKVNDSSWKQIGSQPLPITAGTSVRALVWKFEPTEDMVLRPQETMTIDLSEIITQHPTGETNLYLNYRYVKYKDVYKDGQFVCQIEKAPLVFDDKVRVGKKSIDIFGRSNDVLEIDSPLEVDGDTIHKGKLDVKGNADIKGRLRVHEPDSNADIELERGDTNNFLKLKAEENLSRITFAKKLFIYKGDDYNTRLEIDDAGLYVNGRIKDKTGWVIPVGTVVPYAGPKDCEGWLYCNGQQFSKSKFPELYELLGDDHVPDLRQRFIVGARAVTGYYLNDRGGENRVTLKEKEMPKHNHEYSQNYNGLVKQGVNTIAGGVDTNDNSENEINLWMAYPIKPAGGNESHENRPPYHALHYIIKT